MVSVPYAELKEQLKTASDLSHVGEFFEQQFGGNPAFMEESEAGDNPRLQEVIHALGARILGREVQGEEWLVARVPAAHLWHGMCFMDGRPAQFFYFDDSDIGLLVIRVDPDQGRDAYLRFSVFELPADAGFPGRSATGKVN